MSKTQSTRIRKVVRVLAKECENAWVAQCLEYDIAAQAATWAELKEAFAATFAAEIAVSLKLTGKPLGGIPKAPEEYFAAYEKGDHLRAIHLCDFHSIPKDAKDVEVKFALASCAA